VTAAARMMPVASPAAQWTVLPTPCFQSGAVKRSCSPGARLLVGKDVEQESERAHIERNQAEAPRLSSDLHKRRQRRTEMPAAHEFDSLRSWCFV
jgi:hypothetical protein